MSNVAWSVYVLGTRVGCVKRHRIPTTSTANPKNSEKRECTQLPQCRLEASVWPAHLHPATLSDLEFTLAGGLVGDVLSASRSSTTEYSTDDPYHIP